MFSWNRGKDVAASHSTGQHNLLILAELYIRQHPGFHMTTVYDVPPNLLIERLAERLKSEGKVEPPPWAKFVKTGVHKEKSPNNEDWWYTRVAAVLRKVYVMGPVGSSRLAAEFGGKVDAGSKPYHARKGSRKVIREVLKQLEELNLVQRSDHTGRIVTPVGRSLLDNLAHEILKDLAKENPELSKYL